MRRITIGAGLFAAILLVAVSTAFAAVPSKVSVQGRLTDSAGSPVPDGSYMITFTLWDAPTGGAMVASEIQNVTVTDGLFSANLEYDGEKFAGGSSRYLQYQIQGDPPITPRVLMTSSPYSLISSRVSGDIETSAGELKLRRGSVSASNFRIVGDDDGDLFNVEAKPDSTKIRIIRHSSGDPDFDLLRIVGGSSNSGGTQVDGAMIAITGDPDFDLLRVTAGKDSAKIRISAQSSGDPDFDLLRISGGGGPSSGGAEMSMGGDPDFDLLRVSADKDSAKIRISGQSSGDPDFDLLRIVGGVGSSSSGASMTITGDPDFDLLRISADADSAKIRMSGQISGDPDFDLLRIVGGSGSSRLSMQSEPSGAASISHAMDVSCDSSGADLRLRVVPSAQTVGTTHMHVDDHSASLRVATGDVTGDGIELSADNTGKYLVVGSTHYLDGTRSSDDEVVKTFSWKQLGGPFVTRMQMRADSLGSSTMCRGLRGYDVILLSDQNGAKMQLEDSANNVMMEMLGEGRLGVGKPADNVKRIDVLGGAFCNGTNWVNASDVNSKENFRPIDAQELLNKLAQLEITEWNYRGEGENARHIGPTAQDFYKLFGIGNDDKSISTIDPAGISLVAIKELYKKSKEVDQLKQQVDDLSKQLLEIREQLKHK